jgi:ANTAR domain-containing protein/GAF domain-containing protein
VTDTLTAVDYASITASRGQGYTTVAASSDLALAVDQAQYADEAGPCLHSLESAAPIGVPDIAATMSWPGFHQAAHELGLHASLSIPLFAGSGVPIAVLNLYSRDTAGMAPLIAGTRNLYTGQPPPPGNRPNGMDTGAQQLLAGLAQAFIVRDTIQRAFGVLMARDHCSPAEAYRHLRLRAAESGISLGDTATALLDAARPHSHPPD